MSYYSRDSRANSQNGNDALKISSLSFSEWEVNLEITFSRPIKLRPLKLEGGLNLGSHVIINWEIKGFLMCKMHIIKGIILKIA